MKVKRLKKILSGLNDDTEIYIGDFPYKGKEYDIEYIEKKESVYAKGYNKSRSLNILLKEKRK